MHRHPVTWFLLPFSFIYGIVVYIRNLLFDWGILRSVEFTLPIIGVGNITVGGTGKTPHTEYLIRLLKDRFSIAMLSRGYRRKSLGFILADSSSRIEEIGDEPFQIFRKFPSIAVAVDRNRVQGIRQLQKQIENLDAVLLDDAYQHRWVKPGISILLIDYNRLIIHDALLPAGRLREPVSGKQRAHIIVITKCPEKLKPIERRIITENINPLPHQRIFFSSFRYGKFIPVFPGATNDMDQEEFKRMKPFVLLLTGIANPGMLKDYLIDMGGEVTDARYPDHHEFSSRDILHVIRTFDSIRTSSKIIVTTEKDSVRLQSFVTLDDDIKQRLFYVPVEVEFLNDDKKEFDRQIITYIMNCQRNRIIVDFPKHPSF